MSNLIRNLLLAVRVILGCTLITMLGLMGFRQGGLLMGFAGAALGFMVADQLDKWATR